MTQKQDQTDSISKGALHKFMVKMIKSGYFVNISVTHAIPHTISHHQTQKYPAENNPKYAGEKLLWKY